MKNTRVRNQRVSNTRQRKQQHLLEVTVRREKAAGMRNRAIFAFSCKLLFVAALLAGTYLGGKEALRRFLWENPDYFLTDVRVSTDGALTREQILTTGGIVEGRNIFTLNLVKARAALDELPQAEHVEIQRILPNRVNIDITERRPIAWVTAKADEDPSSSEKSFLIDARGVVMRSKTVLSEYLHLPVISGVEVENLAPGQRVQTIEMQSALELVRLNADSTRFQARNIDLSKGYCLMVTDRTHARITFGLDRVDLQLDRLNRLLDHLESGQREIQTVNLLVERNMPVTFTDQGSEPLEAAPLKLDSSHEKLPSGKASATTTVAAKATPISMVKLAPFKAASLPPKKATKTSPVNEKLKKAAAPKPVQENKVPAGSLKKPFRLND